MYKMQDWYWMIGADDQNVWSSKRYSLVPIGDADYSTWLTMNVMPSPIPTMQELYGVLAAQYPAGSLPTHNAAVRYSKASGGVVISSISAIPFFTDPVSRNTVDSAYNYAVANPGHITDWKLSDGSFIKLTEAQLAKVLQDMAGFVQACFTCESTNATAITGGTITTLAQIDAAFAAISNVYP